MTRSLRRLLGASALLAVMLPGLRAAPITLANYNFSGGSLASVVTVPGTTPGFFDLGGAGLVSAGTSLAYFKSSDTPAGQAAALDAGNLNFFSFTIEVEADSVINLSRLQFRTMFNGTAAAEERTATYLVQSSIGGFGDAAPILATYAEAYQGPAGSTQTQRTISLSALEDFQGLDGTVEFRIYVYDDSDNADHFVRVGNVGLIGEVSAIPEPASAAAVFGALGLLAALGLRRQPRRARPL